ncbi:hypothetical protein [Erythrobacter sp.]|uniref:hypothetical protein n=1 Tax=Erythrobacter sp. TaxID=1042 RepID=UPI0025D7D97C|nr:hypothetical protein [Erythrobacter sp.]
MGDDVPRSELDPESALVLALRHRLVTELAAAEAALALTRARSPAKQPLIDRAFDRLSYQLRAERLLANPGTPELGDAARELCRCIAAYHAEQPAFRLRIVGRPLVFDDATMRVLLLVLSELLNNAATLHASGRDPIQVSLRTENKVLGIAIIYRCADNEPQMSETLIDALRRLIAPCHASFICQISRGRAMFKVLATLT